MLSSKKKKIKKQKPAQDRDLDAIQKVLSIRVSGGVDSLAMLKKMRISVHYPFNQSTFPVFVQPLASPLHKGFLIKINHFNIYELTYGFPTLAVVVQSDLMKNQLFKLGRGSG